MYEVKRIASKEEIGRCELFQIDHYMWDSKATPKAWGRMGYLTGEGFYVSMTCEEKDPLRTYSHYMDRVCNDSAMEIFLAFPAPGEALSNDCMYLNFEANANGALYAKYGKGRKGRQPMPEAYLPACACSAKVEASSWTLSFTIPEAFLANECGVGVPDETTELYCNFYKISETPEIEHYGSFHPIISPTPNFHLPVCFEPCRIQAT